jgi:hypothetical protein
MRIKSNAGAAASQAFRTFQQGCMRRVDGWWVFRRFREAAMPHTCLPGVAETPLPRDAGIAAVSAHTGIRKGQKRR